MARFKENVGKLLTNAQVALDNGRNTSEIFEVVSRFGYDNARFDEGVRLREEAFLLVSEQMGAFSDQKAVHRNLVEARGKVQTLYNTHRAFVRLALKGDRERLAALGVGDTRQQSFNGWLGQVNTFYTHLSEDTQTLQRLAAYNIGPQQIQSAREALLQTIELNRLHKQRRAEARETRQARDRALFALRDWLNEFRIVARIAFADTPNTLIALGFQ